jgi:hypothetical protein
MASSAQWLSHACGIAHRTAVEHVRVGGPFCSIRRVAHRRPQRQGNNPGEYLKPSSTAGSRWQPSARPDPERGALVGAATDAIIQPEGGSPADAVLWLAEIGLAALTNTNRQPRDSGYQRAAVVIHLDAARVTAPNDSSPRSAERNPDDASLPRSAARGRQVVRPLPAPTPGSPAAPAFPTT